MESVIFEPIKTALKKAALKAGFAMEGKTITLEIPKTAAHGHLSTNLAMAQGGNPRDAAQKIIVALKHPAISKAEMAGPGFINLWLTPDFFAEALKSPLPEPLKENKSRTMLIDYSHPNIAKPMGVHHLLSTIIGDAVKKTYRRLGYKVIADNFIGDMGTQFGKLIHAIKKWGNLKAIEKNPIPELLKLYVQFHIEADADVELDDEARAEYKKFEAGDAETRKLWKKIVQWSKLEMQPIYDRLQVEFDEMNGESFYETKMQPILDRGRKQGVIVEGNEGAWIIPPENPEDPPVLVRKRDGATLYLTRDLARIEYWQNTWHPELMVNVVDIAQELHFKQLFYAAEKLGLTRARQVHVKFGRMQFADGAMSTRKGNILQLSKVLDEAEERALVLVREKAPSLSPAEQKELARILGIGSVKYNVLHQNRQSNITFHWDRMLSFEGHSCPYLAYTAARSASVLRKAELDEKKILKAGLEFENDRETRMAIHLLAYQNALQRAADEFKPNLIAAYLYELAQQFNGFYNDLPILQAPSEALKKSRLKLTAAVSAVLKDGMTVLGLEVPEKM